MESADQEILRKNLVALSTDLNPKDVYDALIAGGVLSFQDTERIGTKGTQRDKARELINVLLRKGPNAFGVFMDALQ
ncbi:hypothetical protein CAPTEDRAFT_134296, partial [Capitella teleta]